MRYCKVLKKALQKYRQLGEKPRGKSEDYCSQNAKRRRPSCQKKREGAMSAGGMRGASVRHKHGSRRGGGLARASDDQSSEGYWATAVKRAAAAAAAMERSSAAHPSAAPIAGLLQCEPINRLLARFEGASTSAHGALVEPQLSWMNGQSAESTLCDAPATKRRKQAQPRRIY